MPNDAILRKLGRSGGSPSAAPKDLRRARAVFMTRKDEALFSEALREKFPTIGFLDGLFADAPVGPVRDSLGDCTHWAGAVIVAPDAPGWSPDLNPDPGATREHRVRNLPARRLAFFRSRWLWRMHRGYENRDWAWDPPTLECGRVATDFPDGDPNAQRIKDFFVEVWRVTRKLSTNRLKIGHELTNKLMGGGPVLMKSQPGSDYWAGFHALEWCSQRPRRMLGGRYRPCDDWAPPDSTWYRKLVRAVEERYGTDFGNPPEEEPGSSRTPTFSPVHFH